MLSPAIYRASPRFGELKEGLLCAGLALAVACESEYPLPPTFCDNWCRVTLQAQCGEDPEDCVEDCELTRATGLCSPLQAQLLECYQQQRPEQFVCAGGGNESKARVAPEVCQAQRDSLFECAAAGMGQCLAVCRGTQQSQLAAVAVAGTQRLDFRQLSLDASVGLACPALDQPCEDICWSVFGLRSAGLEAVGVAGASGEGLPATVACLQSSLLQCFEPDVAAAVASPAGDAGSPVPAQRARGAAESIRQTLARCGSALLFR